MSQKVISQLAKPRFLFVLGTFVSIGAIAAQSAKTSTVASVSKVESNQNAAVANAVSSNSANSNSVNSNSVNSNSLNSNSVNSNSAGEKNKSVQAANTRSVNGHAIVDEGALRMPGEAYVAGDAGSPVSVVWPYAAHLQPLPKMSGVRLLYRRDALIVYIPTPVAGAVDYRAYVTDTATQYSAHQPQRKVIACAGYKQYPRTFVDSQIGRPRELMRTIELPGIPKTGTVNVVIEAVNEPCPFTGVKSTVDASVPSNSTVAWYTNGSVPYVSKQTEISKYGSEIINGSGVDVDWNAPWAGGRGQPKTPSNTFRAISAVQVQFNMPDVREPPVTNFKQIMDDFSTPIGPNGAEGLQMSVLNDDLAQSATGYERIHGIAETNNWVFWGRNGHAARGTNPMDSMQVFTRHGRLYTVISDWYNEVISNLHFAAKKPPVAMSSTKFLHSFFRVNSNATLRRYWHWMLCGASTRAELVDAANKPKILYRMDPFFEEPNGPNPGFPLSAWGTPHFPDSKQECLQIVQKDGDDLAKQVDPSNPNSPFMNSGSSLRAFINVPGNNTAQTALGPKRYFKTDAKKNYAGPLLDSWTHENLLAHYDVFVRKNLVALYLNGRQLTCWKIPTPLTMKYGVVVYGQVLYHSDLEFQEINQQRGGYTRRSGQYKYIETAPTTDTRVWDAVGHGQLTAGPTPALGGMQPIDETQCF